MKTIPIPHDSLFKKFFSDASVVNDFLQIHLPPALREICDFGTLAISSGSFVENNFSTRYSDMLYSMHTSEGEGYVYCLIEHQSSADEMMAFRLLRYSIAAMHHHLEQGHKKLPLVIPLLFYHGRQSPYPYSTLWLDCFHNPDVAQMLYCQAFPLVDITVIPDNEIKTHRKVALLDFVQKHIRARDINVWLPDIVFLLKFENPSKEQVKSLLSYLTQEGNNLDLETLLRILMENTPRYREEMMTLAENLKLEGRSEQTREIALNLLFMGLDRATIERATGLSSNELDALMEPAA
ncbi:Rpn family recombination-promoting nuclease/putative transposase [Sodalis ligni]|uniref:Rpn family recombination-promoting nuclease/putative transposase n=1 Tax=Sodalis ligni TaxID=2697027 RepID=UPI001BDF6BD5|nr:Rpn family recombination-promoting nuclease/putative transposase [Sodalis ligni]QWA11266.1 Rpn family recombination-promoting nuclease/putative transposase [Sodalis ligni]